MKNYSPKEFFLFLCIIISIISIHQISAAQSEKEWKTLLLFYKENDLVITPTRHSKTILQVAENISVITSEEIEMINAHTLKDVLSNIPGVQIDIKGGPATDTKALIQGSEFRHVLLMIDGVAVNNLSDNFADIAAIPIQNIERVEIIKGPASSSWGSSLGGIIHVITKSPSDSERIQGVCSAFYGERNTKDFGAEVSGTVRNSGYYFYAGNLNSDGLTEIYHYDEDNIYTKLSWNLTDRGSLLFTFGHNKGSRGVYKIPQNDTFYENTFKYLFSTFSLKHSINNKTGYRLSFRSSSKDFDTFIHQISTGTELQRDVMKDSAYGGSIDLTWKHGIHNILLGFDIDKGKLESSNISNDPNNRKLESTNILDGKQYLKKWAIFSNNTIMINRFSLTPGIRYDYTNTNGDYVSPSFGLTYKMTERNLFRGYIARGFHIPPLGFTFMSNQTYVANPDLKVEKIWSIQAGMESTALKYLWFKATLFHHNIWDAIYGKQLEAVDPNSRPKITTINKKRQKRYGIETEIKTVPVYNTSLFAGFSYINAKDKDTGEKLGDVPIHTFDIGINYYNNKSFRAYLKGHYIYWHTRSSDRLRTSREHNFIWDINLIKRFHWNMKTSVQTFLTIHNIFDGSQYFIEVNKNPGRWIEAGLKFKF